MSTGIYGNTTAGWCGNCGRRRGADGRCANCDPWWTSPLFQTGGPIILLVSLILIVSLSVLGKRQESASNGGGNRIPANVITPNIPANRITSYVPRPNTPVNIPPPVSMANYPPPPTQEQIQYQQLQELRRVTAYVDKVVETDQAAQAQRKRLESQYPAPARRSLTRSGTQQANMQSF